MSHADVYKTVSPVVPIRHLQWPEGHAPKLPWAVYTCEDDPIGVDNAQIATRHKYTVELYETVRDSKLEHALEKALKERFGTIERDESWIKSDQMLQVRYTFYQIEGDFDG